MVKNNDRICSFCGKSNYEVKKMIVGKDVFICNECILLSNKALQEEKKQTFFSDELIKLTPKKIKEEFDKLVIGQETAKKKLAVAVANHYKKLLHGFENFHDHKVNCLMIGPTGCGKTLLVKVLENILSKIEVPVVFADAATLTETGYVGDDVENILLRLVQKANYNIAKAQQGIVFIDEIDKIAAKNGGGSLNRDISGEGVQQSLLAMLQGKISSISLQGNKKNINQESVEIDTTGILFICAGAFANLKNIVEERMNSSSMGFDAKINSIKKEMNYSHVEQEDLIKFGMIPEFVGRLHSIISLKALNKEDLIKILTNGENALLNQYKSLFKLNDCVLNFENDAISYIADMALKKSNSARFLKNMLEDLFHETMFELEENAPCEIFVDKESVKNNKPKVLKKKKIDIRLEN